MGPLLLQQRGPIRVILAAKRRKSWRGNLSVWRRKDTLDPACLIANLGAYLGRSDLNPRRLARRGNLSLAKRSSKIQLPFGKFLLPYTSG